MAKAQTMSTTPNPVVQIVFDLSLLENCVYSITNIAVVITVPAKPGQLT